MQNEAQDCLLKDKHVDEEKEKRIAEQFTRDILARGKAAKSQDGKLPPGVTHEIVETKEGELPKIRRRRFSLR